MGTLSLSSFLTLSFPPLFTPSTHSTMSILMFILPFLLSTVSAQAPPMSQDMVCDICIQAVTAFDEWLTEDSTEAEIVHQVEQICAAISSIVPEAMCKSMIESQLPSIIDGLVNDYLKPKDICVAITACSSVNGPQRFMRLV